MASRVRSTLAGAAGIVLVSVILALAVNTALPGGVPVLTPPPSPPGEPLDFVQVWEAFDRKDATFIDARPADEYEYGHIPGAVNVPLLERDRHLPALRREIPPERKIIVYCDGEECEASEKLSAWLKDRGWKNVYVFTDGYPSWLAAGMEIAKGESP
jgi:rhodanese-related sulfurtransferase